MTVHVAAAVEEEAPYGSHPQRGTAVTAPAHPCVEALQRVHNLVAVVLVDGDVGPAHIELPVGALGKADPWTHLQLNVQRPLQGVGPEGDVVRLIQEVPIVAQQVADARPLSVEVLYAEGRPRG